MKKQGQEAKGQAPFSQGSAFQDIPSPALRAATQEVSSKTCSQAPGFQVSPPAAEGTGVSQKLSREVCIQLFPSVSWRGTSAVDQISSSANDSSCG